MKRHQLDLFSLIAGLFVIAIGVAAIAPPWRVDVGPWAWPTVLVLAGLAVLALVLVRGRDEDADADAHALGGGDETDPDREAAVSAAYAELDDEVTLPDHHDV